MTGFNKSDKSIAIVTLVAIAIVAASAFVLIAMDRETSGETVTLESESVFLDPQKFNRYTVRAPGQLCIDPIVYYPGNGEIGFQSEVEYPAQGMEFRYLEMEWSLPDGISPSHYYGSLFHYGDPGMSVSYGKKGDHGFLARYDLPKHHIFSPDTHVFRDAIEFLAGSGNQSISITYRVGYASDGVVSEFIKTYEFTFPIPSEGSFMQDMHFVFSGLPSSSDRNQLLYSWPRVPIGEPTQLSYAQQAGADSTRIVLSLPPN